MALSRINAVCTKCGTEFSEVPTQSFLGFQKLVCPKCSESLTYPLTGGYRIVYIVLFVIMLFAIIRALAQGEFGFPGFFGIAVTIALIKDMSIRKRLK